jgi:hypothetical protein
MIIAMWVISVPLVVGVERLGGPPISRDAAVARALTEARASFRDDWPPEVRTAVEESVRQSTIQRWEGDQPAPKVAWAMVALMTVAGGALLFDARRRWLNLELG